MSKLITAILTSLFAVSVYAQAPAKVETKPAAPAASMKAEAKPAAAAPAADSCEAQAVSKDGKPLFGAAKAAKIKKCEADKSVAKKDEKKVEKADKKADKADKMAEKKAEKKGDMKGDCEGKAVGKDGKPLAGAAKDASMKKCMSGK